MRRAPLLAGLLAALAAGCSSTAKTFPSSGSVIPNWSLQLGPGVNVGLDKIVYWGAYAGAAYLILDPLAPNWQIEEARLSDTRYHLALHMKRYYAGGAGEARVVFDRRARELVREREAAGYEVLEYSEGLESSVIGSRRTSTGVIRLLRKSEPAATVPPA